MVCFISADGKLQERVISSDTCIIYCKAVTVRDAMPGLLMFYYAMDLDYLRIYSQVLGLLHELVTSELFTRKSSKCTKLKNNYQKQNNYMYMWLSLCLLWTNFLNTLFAMCCSGKSGNLQGLYKGNLALIQFIRNKIYI